MMYVDLLFLVTVKIVKILCSAPGHYLIQCWVIVNWAIGTIFIKLDQDKQFSCKKKSLKSSAKWRSFCLGLIVLTQHLNDISESMQTTF